MTIVNPTWKRDLKEKMDRGHDITLTVSYRVAAQWLIKTLADKGIPYAVKQLGCGVVAITTETDKCPCCKKTL